jgi:hypothetical protein
MRQLSHSAKALPGRTNTDDIKKQNRRRFRSIKGRCYRRMGENFMSGTLINCIFTYVVDMLLG